MSDSSYKQILFECIMALWKPDGCRPSESHSNSYLEATARDEEKPFNTDIHDLLTDETFRTYYHQSKSFIDYVRNMDFEVNHLIYCRPFVTDYFNDMVINEISPWTIHTRIFALAKIFQCNVRDFELTLPSRRRKDIKRCRTGSKTDERFKSEKYRQIRLFASVTGAKRSEFSTVKKSDLIEGSNGDLLIHFGEDDDRKRDALVLPEFAELVKQIVSDSPGYGTMQTVFPIGYIPRSLTVNCYRAVYAQRLYEVLRTRSLGNGVVYHCRGEIYGLELDKGLLVLVSRYMGLSTYAAIVERYFYEVRRDSLPQDLKQETGGECDSPVIFQYTRDPEILEKPSLLQLITSTYYFYIWFKSYHQ